MVDNTEQVASLQAAEISETPEEKQLDAFLEEETHVPEALKNVPVD